MSTTGKRSTPFDSFIAEKAPDFGPISNTGANSSAALPLLIGPVAKPSEANHASRLHNSATVDGRRPGHVLHRAAYVFKRRLESGLCKFINMTTFGTTSLQIPIKCCQWRTVTVKATPALPQHNTSAPQPVVGTSRFDPSDRTGEMYLGRRRGTAGWRLGAGVRMRRKRRPGWRTHKEA